MLASELAVDVAVEMVLDAVDVVLEIADVVMPVMSGPALAGLLTGRNPRLKVLFMSGHAANRADLEEMLGNGVQFLPKPFTSDALIRKVRETLSEEEQRQSCAPPGGSN